MIRMGLEKVRIGHSPDPDDAFMFYGITSGRVKGALHVEHVIEDIESLNRRALSGELEVTAISAHAYGKACDKYSVLRAGSSFGLGYGPILVARKRIDEGKLPRVKIAVPGEMTSAYALLRIALGKCNTVQMGFDHILNAVREGVVDCGLIIHEGQLTYERLGLLKVLDLGDWWNRETRGLPVPLGLNAVRRDTESVAPELNRMLRESIQFGRANFEDALNYALRYSRWANSELVSRFVGMYVNDLTLDMGERGRGALEEFFRRAHDAALIDTVSLRVV